jgi:hypothetical protein
MVFNMRPMRRILRAKRGEVREALRKICDDELHKFYSTPVIIRMINSRTRFPGHVEREDFFFNLNSGGVESRSTRHCGHLMAYCVSPG